MHIEGKKAVNNNSFVFHNFKKQSIEISEHSCHVSIRIEDVSICFKLGKSHEDREG